MTDILKIPLYNALPSYCRDVSQKDRLLYPLVPSHFTYFITSSWQTFISSFLVSWFNGRTLHVELSCYNYFSWQTVRWRFGYSLFYFTMLQLKILFIVQFLFRQTVCWMSQNNEQRFDLCSSADVVRVLKEDEMGWERGTYGFWWRNLKHHSDDLYVDGRIILKWTIMYNKPTRCNSGSIVFIKNYKYALHVSDALCVHHQEHYKL